MTCSPSQASSISWILTGRDFTNLRSAPVGDTVDLGEVVLVRVQSELNGRGPMEGGWFHYKEVIAVNQEGGQKQLMVAMTIHHPDGRVEESDHTELFPINIWSNEE